MYDYSQYYTAASSISDASAFGAVFGALAGFFAVFMIIAFAIAIVELVGMWKMYTKAGEAGWKCLIPIYNVVILFKIAGISPWLVLGYLATIIPGIGALVALGITIYAMVSLAKAYGQSGWFAAGLIFFQPIFMCILGFGKAEYQGNSIQE